MEIAGKIQILSYSNRSEMELIHVPLQCCCGHTKKKMFFFFFFFFVCVCGPQKYYMDPNGPYGPKLRTPVNLIRLQKSPY